jgi:phthalate 4,5-dioxygenase oxygenase subunit
MLRAEDNQFLTESSAGTGMGEELLAFRDSRGVVGVIDQYRPHRGANLGPTDLGIMHFRKLVTEAARALQQGEAPSHLAHQDRYAVRSGACVTSKAKDLPAVMVERFGDATGYVGRPQNAAAE